MSLVLARNTCPPVTAPHCARPRLILLRQGTTAEPGPCSHQRSPPATASHCARPNIILLRQANYSWVLSILTPVSLQLQLSLCRPRTILQCVKACLQVETKVQGPLSFPPAQLLKAQYRLLFRWHSYLFVKELRSMMCLSSAASHLYAEWFCSSYYLSDLSTCMNTACMIPF